MDRAGIAFALLSAAAFGASTPVAKILLASIDPWILAGVLYLGAGAGLAAVHGGRCAIASALSALPTEVANAEDSVVADERCSASRCSSSPSWFRA